MKWRRSRAVLWRAAPGYLALATPDGRLTEAFGPAPDIWAGLADWVDEAALAESLGRQFDAETRVVAADIRRFLVQLRDQGAVDARE